MTDETQNTAPALTPVTEVSPFPERAQGQGGRTWNDELNEPLAQRLMSARPDYRPDTAPELIPPQEISGRFMPPYAVSRREQELSRIAFEEVREPDGSPDDQVRYFRQLEDQRMARAALTLADRAFATDGKFRADVLEKALAMGINPDTDPQDLESLVMAQGWRLYGDTIAGYGEIPVEIASDPDFMRYATPETLAYVKAVHEIRSGRGSGWTDIVSDAFDYQSAARDIAYRYTSGEIDIAEKNRLDYINEWEHGRDGTLFTTASVVAGMSDAVFSEQGLKFVTAGAALGGVAGAAFGGVGGIPGAVAGALRGALQAAGASFLADSFTLSQSEIASTAQNENPRLTQEEALREAIRGAALSAALDFVPLGVFAATGGKIAVGALGRMLGATAKIAAQTVKAGGNAATAMSADRALREGLRATFGAVALNYGTEVVTEGTQGAIQRAEANRIAGTDASVSDAFWDNAAQAAEVMLWLAPLSGIPHAARTARRTLAFRSETGELAEVTAQEAVASQSDLAREGKPLTAAATMYRTFAGEKDYFMTEDLLEAVNEGRVEPSVLGDAFGDVRARAEAGETYIAIDRALWSSKYANRPEYAALEELRRTAPGKRNGKELQEDAEVFSDPQWRAENVDGPVMDRVNTVRDAAEIRRDLDEKLFLSGKVKDRNAAALVTDQAVSLFTSLHEVIPAFSALDLYRLTGFKVEGDRLDVREGADNSRRPAFDLERMALRIQRNAPLADLEHEMAHFYFETLFRVEDAVRQRAAQDANLTPQLAEIEKITGRLREWGGFDDYFSLSEKKKRGLHENFAIGFVRSLVTGTPDTGNREALRFRTMLSRALRKEITGRMGENFEANRAAFLQQRGAEKWTPALEREWLGHYLDEERAASAREWGFDPISRDTEIEQISARLFMAERKLEETEQEFPLMDEPLQRLGSLVTDPEDLAAIQRLEDENLKLRAQTQSAIDGIMTITGNVLYKGTRKIRNVLDRIAQFPEGLNGARYKLFRKFLHHRSDFKNHYREAIAEVRADPIQQIRSMLLGNSEYPAAVKLDPEAVKALMPADSSLYRTLKRRGYIAPKGWQGGYFPLEQGAVALGRTRSALRTVSPDRAPSVAFLEALAQTENTRRTAMRLAVTRLFRNEMRDDVDEAVAASEYRALGTKVRAKLYRQTVDVLRRLMAKKGLDPETGKRPVLSAESAAKAAVRGLTWRDLRPSSILRQTKYFDRKALSALAKGDLVSAATHFEQSEILARAAEEGYAKSRELRDRMRKLRDTLSKPDKEIGKTHAIERVQVARALLSRVGILPSHRLEKAMQVIESYASDSLKSEVRELMSADFSAAYYADLRLPVLEKVLSLAEEQVALARADDAAIKKVLGAQAETVRKALIAVMNDLHDATETASLGNGETATSVTAKSRTRGAFYRLFQRHVLKPLPFFTRLDGGKEHGFTEYIYRPMRGAEDDIKSETAKYRREFTELLSKVRFKQGTYKCLYLRTAGRGKNSDIFSTVCFGEAGKFKGVAGAEILGLVLHLGNESNLRKLCGGYNVTVEQLMAEVRRMEDMGFITKETYQLAQAIWDRNQTIFEKAQKAYRRIHGFFATELQPREIVTRWGTFRGGYVPALTNQALENFSHISVDPKALLELNEFKPTAIGKGAEGAFQERVEAFQQPLSFDTEALLNQNERLIRYAHTAPVMDAIMKTVQSNSVTGNMLRGEMARFDPEMWNEWIVPWLRERVHGVPRPWMSNPVVRFLNALVRQTGAALMCFNVSNTAQQVTGISSAVARVGGSAMMEAMGDWMANHRGTVDSVRGKSAFMRNRLDENQLSIEQSFNNVLLDPSVLHGTAKIKAGAQKASDINMKYAYWIQKAMQNQVDILVWQAGYRDALRRDLSEAEAVAFADETVIMTQGSYDEIDMNGMEKSHPFLRAITMFGSYAWTMANLIYGEWYRAGALPPSQRAMTRTMMVVSAFCVPAILADMINRAMGRDFGEDSDEWYASFWFDTLVGSQLRMGFSMVPVVGQMLTSALNKAQGKTYFTDTRFNSPVFTVSSALLSSAEKFMPWSEDDWTYKDIRNAGVGIASLIPFPYLAPAIRSYSYIRGVGDHDIVPTGAVDLAFGFITGKVSPESKIE